MGRVGQFGGDEHYELIDQLGEGGEGVVYRARHRVRGDMVALKTIPVASPERVLRLKREFRELRELRHPNIVRLHELSEGDGHWYYTMELVDGVNVLEYVRPDGALDLVRLRSVLADLARAVQAIHARGLVHRDLTPRNVLVANGGRVVLIDLGVTLKAAGTSGEEVIGTVAYMAPEQALGADLTSACDWYNIGVILYEALYDELPFRGAHLDVLQNKQSRMPEFAVVGDQATDLVALCRKLLRTLPAERADGDEVLRALGVSGEDNVVAEAIVAASDPNLAALDSAVVAARNGNPGVVLIHGRGGVGKSGLLDQCEARGLPGVLFRAACSADESVRFRALDGVMDSVVEYLVGLPDTAGQLLPVRGAPLVRAFPLLARVEAATRWSSVGEDAAVDGEQLAHAFAELLGAIAEREGCVVVMIDDLHEADGDSLSLIIRLIVHAATRHLLIVGTVRVSDDPLTWVESLHRAAELSDASVSHVVLSSESGTERRVPTVPPEAGFIATAERAWSRETVSGDAWDLLCAMALTASALPRAKAAKALGWNLKQLTARERELADCGAIHGGAAGHQAPLAFVDPSERAYVLDQLDEHFEMWLHKGLGRAFVDDPPDHERAARHLEQCGDTTRAAHRYALAADEAAQALACSRAVHLYGRSLDLLPDQDSRRVGLLARSGDALVASGRTAEAAEFYTRAAAVSQDVLERLELQRCAADCFIRCGHLDEGIAAQRQVLQSMGVKLPETPKAALRSLVWRRVRLRLRGLRYSRREPEAVPVDSAMRIDALLAAGLEMAMVDYIRGGDLQVRALLESLNVGDEHRIARGMTTEAIYQAATGDHARCAKLLAKAEELVVKLDDPFLRSNHKSMSGISTLLRGEWKRGLELTLEGMRLFETECTGAEWELTAGEHFVRWALFYMGDFEELDRRVLSQLRVAEERGDLLAGTTSRAGWGVFVWLARDDPEMARLQYERAAGDWSYDRFLTPHWALLIARVNVALYLGKASEAYGYVDKIWPDVEASMFLRAESRRIEGLYLRARCALAMLASEPEEPRWRRETEKWIRGLSREKLQWPQGLAALCRAARANIDSDRSVAVAEAAKASSIFNATGAHLFESVAEAIACLHDGSMDAGEFLASRIHGVRRPIALASMLIPGFSANVEWVNEAAKEAVPIVRVPIDGHLTLEMFRGLAATAAAELRAEGSASLLIDTIAMSGYDAPVRLEFVVWYRAHKRYIRRCAFATDRPERRLIVRTLALLASAEMKPFSRAADAIAWASRS